MNVDVNDLVTELQAMIGQLTVELVAERIAGKQRDAVIADQARTITELTERLDLA